MILFHVTLPGPVKGGKNSIGITRTGMRYPKKAFVEWRNRSAWYVLAAKRLLIGKTFPILVPVRATIHYYPPDRRRRDVPALIDGLWHLLEHKDCGIVADDALIEDVYFVTHRDAPKENAGVTVTMEAK